MTDISKEAVEWTCQMIDRPLSGGWALYEEEFAKIKRTLRALRAELDRSEARVAELEGVVPEGWRQDRVAFRNYPFVVMDTRDGWMIEWHHRPAGVSHFMDAVFETSAQAMAAADIVRQAVDGKTCNSANYAAGTAALADERKEPK